MFFLCGPLFKRNQSMFLIAKDEFNDTTNLNIPQNLKVNNFDKRKKPKKSTVFRITWKLK